MKIKMTTFQPIVMMYFWIEIKELEKLLIENKKLEAAIEELKAKHSTELQSLLAEREEERETVKKLYKRLTEVVENSGE